MATSLPNPPHPSHSGAASRGSATGQPQMVAIPPRVTSPLSISGKLDQPQQVVALTPAHESPAPPPPPAAGGHDASNPEPASGSTLAPPRDVPPAPATTTGGVPVIDYDQLAAAVAARLSASSPQSFFRPPHTRPAAAPAAPRALVSAAPAAPFADEDEFAEDPTDGASSPDEDEAPRGRDASSDAFQRARYPSW